VHPSTVVAILGTIVATLGIVSGWLYGAARFFERRGKTVAEEKSNYTSIINKLADIVAQKDREHEVLHKRIDKFELEVSKKLEKIEDQIVDHREWHLDHDGRRS
jgi:hypothetical protein